MIQLTWKEKSFFERRKNGSNLAESINFDFEGKGLD